MIGIGLMGLVVFAYHVYSIYLERKSNLLSNLFHAFIVAPLLLWISYKKKETSREVYDAILLLAFATLGYHSYTLSMQACTVSANL